MGQGTYFLVVLLTGLCVNGVCQKQQFGLHVYRNKQLCIADAARLQEEMPKYRFSCAEITET